jgi:uncharacterized protein (UPF0548 family)
LTIIVGHVTGTLGLSGLNFLSMFVLSKPSEKQIRDFLVSQRDRPLSYPYAGTGNLAPAGYKTDHNRIKLGEGAEVFERAVDALRRWEIFNIGWLQLCWPDAPIEKGSTVAVLGHHLGFWSLNACRIVSVIDDDEDPRQYGFAYGTLPEHVERGQETFTVQWRTEDDSVWYDLLAYSKPKHILAKLGYPITRALQKDFARDSMKAMLRAVNG